MTDKEPKIEFIARINSLGVDRSEIEIIAANQGIPAEVAIELFECKGSIPDKAFLKRIESYEE